MGRFTRRKRQNDYYRGYRSGFVLPARHFGIPLLLSAFIVSAGCLGAISPTNSGTSTPETTVIIGPNHGLPEPDGDFVDSPPVVRSNTSHIIVTGGISGVGDSSCLGATANSKNRSNGTMALTVRSTTESGSGICNGTGGAFYTYRAFVAIDGSPPERLRIRQVGDGPRATHNWTVAVNQTRARTSDKADTITEL